MTSHCQDCGSQLCNHGNCPECNPCRHCGGGDRTNKFFGYDEDGYEIVTGSDYRGGREED